jgi:hypothetical protein
MIRIDFDLWGTYGWFTNKVQGDFLPEVKYDANALTLSGETGYAMKIAGLQRLDLAPGRAWLPHVDTRGGDRVGSRVRTERDRMQINTLRISKYGRQPLLIEWRVDQQNATTFYSAIVLPGSDEPPGYRHVAALKFPCGGDRDRYAVELSTTGRAARILALDEAEKLAAHCKDRSAVGIEQLDMSELRAEVSLGNYPGLLVLAHNNPWVLPGVRKANIERVVFERLVHP